MEIDTLNEKVSGDISAKILNPKGYTKPLIIVPVYNPSEDFYPFILSLHERAKKEDVVILIVNDGCDKVHNATLDDLETLSQVFIVHHNLNFGKGAALKTGILTASKIFPNSQGVVTADADGQHSVEDIFDILDAGQENDNGLLLGVRQFDKDVPFRSKFGNTLTRAIFYMLTSIKIEDTQTGLRHIPNKFFKQMLDIKSSGYAFEMEMLLWTKQNNVEIKTKPIHTIYINDNAASHFRPFIDSIKIYAVLFKQVIASALTAVVDLAAFAAFFALSGGMLFWANAFSRAVAFPVYYFMNRDFVFKQKQLGFHPVPKLIAAIIVSGLFSYGLQYVAQQTLGFPEVVSKLVIETLVFFINFVVLRDFVYRNKDA